MRACPTCHKSYPDAVFFCGEDGTITIQEQDASDRDARLGTRLGGYLVVARVADGAMGRVYEGRHPDTKARVAVKVLHARVARDHVSVERFKREYETSTELSHPHVVKVLEFGETPDHSQFLTMEYLEGRELGQVLGRGHPLAPARIVRVISQTALALEHAHSYGFIHRDLKPDNIFMCATPDGDNVRVLDFGSVKLQQDMGQKLTAIGTTVGSPFYMSPEQAMGRSDVDQRTDVFALGAILYEMITDKVAFDAPNIAKILIRIMNEQPPPPSTQNPSAPGAIDGVVAKALRKAKEQRYGSARELANAVIDAYGLSGSIEEWSKRPQSQIEQALIERMRKTPAEGLPRIEPEPEAAAFAAPEEPRSEPTRGEPTVPKVNLSHEDRGSAVSFDVGMGGGTKALIALALFVTIGLLVLLLR